MLVINFLMVKMVVKPWATKVYRYGFAELNIIIEFYVSYNKVVIHIYTWNFYIHLLYSSYFVDQKISRYSKNLIFVVKSFLLIYFLLFMIFQWKWKFLFKILFIWTPIRSSKPIIPFFTEKNIFFHFFNEYIEIQLYIYILWIIQLMFDVEIYEYRQMRNFERNIEIKLNFDFDKKSTFFDLLLIYLNPDLKLKIDYSFLSLIFIKKIDIFI